MKLIDVAAIVIRLESCPSRGTWIEIMIIYSDGYCGGVVPLAGHVD